MQRLKVRGVLDLQATGRRGLIDRDLWSTRSRRTLTPAEVQRPVVRLRSRKWRPSTAYPVQSLAQVMLASGGNSISCQCRS